MSGAFEYEEDEGDSLLQKLRSRPWLLLVVFLAFLAYGITMVTFDWLWVDDMLNVEAGLVFGPAEKGAVDCLIVLATFGTLAFLFQTANFVWKINNNEDLLNEDIAQLISLFVNEVPSITLNYFLSRCREVPTSYYQLVKAGLGMVGSGLRSLMVLRNYLTPGKNGYKRGLIPLILRSIVLTACLYTFIGAIVVWIFTYTDTGDDLGDDGTMLRPPGSIYSKYYDGGRYFYKAGVYFSHPEFAHCNGRSNWTDPQQNWIKLVSIYDILDDDDETVTTFRFDDSRHTISVTSLGKNACFEVIDCNIKPETNCEMFPGGVHTQIEMRFQNLKKSKTLVFGDIKFKGIVSENPGSQCEDLTADDFGYLGVDTEGTESQFSQLGRIHYFQVTEEVNDTEIFLQSDTGDYNYYQYDPNIVEDMNNVTDVWLTGYHRCPMSGSIAPNPGLKSDIACSVEEKKYDILKDLFRRH